MDACFPLCCDFFIFIDSKNVGQIMCHEFMAWCDTFLSSHSLIKCADAISFESPF